MASGHEENRYVVREKAKSGINTATKVLLSLFYFRRCGKTKGLLCPKIIIIVSGKTAERENYYESCYSV